VQSTGQPLVDDDPSLLLRLVEEEALAHRVNARSYYLVVTNLTSGYQPY
jgi:hypothetical protein